MATGPEHYLRAEDLLAMATEQMMAIAADDPTAGLRSEAIFRLQAAQVHATLANAAATAMNDAEQGLIGNDYQHWRNVASDNPELPEPVE